MATDPMLDPDYKYSINKFTGNGSKTSWDLNFSGGYIRREHVKAYTQAADGQITELSFTWSGPNTIVITPPVANGVRLFVYRDTPKSGPLVDFTDGAIINEFDLDMMARQTVFATAEMVDRFADVAIESQEATATANEALVRAAAAQVDVAAATTASVAALGTAQAAETKANAAVSTANTAKGTADAAAAAAGGAVVTANAADSKATSALSQASTAAGQSASALTTAQGANSKSDNALARALDAQASAANANTIASAAEGTAVETANQFEALRDTVEEIAGGDLSNFVRVTQENTFQATQRFQPATGPAIEVLTPDGTEGFRLGIRGAIAFRKAGVWENAVGLINDWNAVYNKPTEFAPAPHTHTIADVANLQTTLDAKASSSLLGLKADLAGAVFTGPVIRGTWATGGFSRLNPEALLIRSPSQIDIELSHGSGGENPAFIRYTTGNVLTINAPNPIQSNGKTILTGAAVDDAVLKSTTNLGRTGNGPLAAVSNADLAAAPTGWAIMTAPGSSTPGGSYGFFFKTGRRDNSNGWSGIWQGHSGSPNRMYLGWTGAATDAPIWNEVATLGAPGQPHNQNFYGVRAFINDGSPAAEFWNSTGDGLRFGPKGGISFAEGGAWLTSNPNLNLKNFTIRNQDESFRDITAQRGDGSGAIFLGGGAYLYHNTAGVYEFGGTKDVQLAGTARLRYGGGRQPRISVQAAAPTAEMVVGDLWAW